jgi:hypothetical protein
VAATGRRLPLGRPRVARTERGPDGGLLKNGDGMAKDNVLHFDNPNHWRKRAQEARVLAEKISDPIARQSMSRTAEHYEWLAEHAEGQLAQARGEQP